MLPYVRQLFQRFAADGKCLASGMGMDRCTLLNPSFRSPEKKSTASPWMEVLFLERQTGAILSRHRIKKRMVHGIWRIDLRRRLRYLNQTTSMLLLPLAVMDR